MKKSTEKKVSAALCTFFVAVVVGLFVLLVLACLAGCELEDYADILDPGKDDHKIEKQADTLIFEFRAGTDYTLYKGRSESNGGKPILLVRSVLKDQEQKKDTYRGKPIYFNGREDKDYVETVTAAGTKLSKRPLGVSDGSLKGLPYNPNGFRPHFYFPQHYGHDYWTGKTITVVSEKGWMQSWKIPNGRGKYKLLNDGRVIPTS